MVGSDENYSRIWLRKYQPVRADGALASQVPNFSIRCFPYGMTSELDSSMDLIEDSKPAYYWFVIWCAIIAFLMAMGAPVALLISGSNMAKLKGMLFVFCLCVPGLFVNQYGGFINKKISKYLSTKLLKVVSISVRENVLDLYLRGKEPISIPLTSINTIDLLPSKSSDLTKQTIVISGRRMKEPIYIRLSAIHTHENWMIISHALANFASQINIDDGIAKALTLPSADTSFTELWLDSLSSAPEAESLQEIPDGQTLAAGRYLVKSKLASGGQGHAYLCFDQTTQDEVVVKAYLLPVYQGKHLKDVAIQQLEAEAMVLQRINHPQIVQFVDWFSTSSCAFLVLKRISGNNLRQYRANQGPLPTALVKNLTIQMCEILWYLHGSNPVIVHRDFTPDNLIIDGQQKLTLIDFTIAEPTGAVSGLPPAGKPAYMPPEQFRGEASVQSDIYALGGTLQYLLTGCDPVALEQSNLLLTETGVSPLFAEIVFKCRAQRPSDRFQSVDEIVASIHSFIRASIHE
ncbi:MAG: eukaryotic-like serine/threonine-protein kinase [Cyanobacteriota bacterium erpe_2018_sw_21hr_WHONDRS-SW48-000092_B_bin.40]|nr:eukaryotic-like serine/threonine-protein kinase [Cyanobacteriota bacterium erpe_2018_sw_21hr_WHONDRS-SW48-000092_B_bin.40]